MEDDKTWAPAVCRAWAEASGRGETALFELLGSGWLSPTEETQLRRYLGIDDPPAHKERRVRTGGMALAMRLQGPLGAGTS